MEWNENSSIIWEFIASNGPVGLNEISSNLGFELTELKKITFNLIKIKLVNKTSDNKYELNDIITPLDWVNAVDYGIDIASLEKYVKLDTNERKDAIRIASDGTFEKHKIEQDENKKKDFRNYLEGKAMTEAAATDLADRLDDSNKIVEEWKLKEKSNGFSVQEKMTYALIILTNHELQKTYDLLIDKLIKKNER